MPKRQTVKTVKTDEIQGEDSFVTISGVKVSEIKATRKRSLDIAARQKAADKAKAAGEDAEDIEDFDGFGEGLKMIVNHVLDWNWVDDAGNPLSKPQEDQEVFNELTTDEVTFLAELLTGGEEAKN